MAERNIHEFVKKEAERCLKCKNAKCSQGCPVKTDIPRCTRLYTEGKFDEAGDILFDNNPMCTITSRVCDWEKECFGNCILAPRGKSINWYRIEQELSERHLFKFHPRPVRENGKKTAVIGAGPVGITAAVKLRERGFAVTIFDKKEKIGGVLRYGIPEYRLDRKYIEEYERILGEYGIAFVPDTEVGKDISLKEIRSKFDATLIGTGAGVPHKLNIKGENNNPRVIYALDYLENPEKYRLKGKVLVIGGGNVTMDACRTAVRQGCDTRVYYRKTFENMPANTDEVKKALEEGVKFEVFRVPVEIKNGNVAVMRKCKNVTDERGRVSTKHVEGFDTEVEFDTMIVAISNKVDYGIFGEEMPELDDGGWIATNKDQQTSLEDVFLAGDFFLGPKTVVKAVQSAKIATRGILKLMNKRTITEIMEHFEIEGNVGNIEPLGNGLINDTYKAEMEGSGPDYVIQIINNKVFTDVEMLQYNIECVTNHIRKKLEAAGEKDIDRKVLRFIPVKKTGKTYYFDGEKYWRISVFIPNAKTYETVNPENSYYAGRAFGKFEAMLADMPEKLEETIPDFHNMELRLNQLKKAVKENKAGRMDEKNRNYKNIKEILGDVEKYGKEMCRAERLFREGKLPKRICHCDTKVNNIMFDTEGNVLCVIDLDTVMPSFVFSDFGDFLRTAANTGKEDSRNLRKVEFDMEIFKAFTKGYLESANCFLTPAEKENLPYAACLFPFMQAVRFFTDYLNGDTYYKIDSPDHNMIRTRAQMKLFHSALDKVDEMKEYIESL